MAHCGELTLRRRRAGCRKKHGESHAPGLTDTSPYLGSRTKSEEPLSLCLGRTSQFCAVLNPAVAVLDRPQCRPQTAPPALASRAGPQSRCRLLPRSGSASTVRAPQQLGMPITGQPRAQLSGAVLLRDATHPRISTTPHVAPRLPCLAVREQATDASAAWCTGERWGAILLSAILACELSLTFPHAPMHPQVHSCPPRHRGCGNQ